MKILGHSPQLVEEHGVYLIEDVVFRKTPEKDLVLDLLYPTEKIEAARPMIIYIHGGAYRAGHQKWYPKPLSYNLVKEGYIVFSVSYRLSYLARYPALLYDVKAGVRWVRAHAKELGGDPACVGVFGESAGGHLSAFLGTCGDLPIFSDGDHLDYSSAVQAVCDMFGPTDFYTMPDHYQANGNSPLVQLVGGFLADRPDEVRGINPATYIHHDLPPFYFVHGEQDDEVTINQSEALYAALKTAGYSPEFLRVNNAKHGLWQIDGNTPTQPLREEVDASIVAFFNKHLKK